MKQYPKATPAQNAMAVGLAMRALDVLYFGGKPVDIKKLMLKL